MPKYSIPIFIVIFAVSNIYAQVEPQYPVPVSENAEKVGPNTMTFLSYPKYYRLANNELTPVVTNLVNSKAAAWDYEVTTGIWSLYVKSDGTFRADHAGDSFTYQFSDIGIGSGKNFKSLNLGKLNWENIRVMGDTIRWNDVLPNVDVSVRYINDILKVDVIVKKVLMQTLRVKKQTGEINSEDFLTAKFNITGVLLNSQAKQGDQIRDLYAEATDINQPLQFWKEDKVVHTLRPVEAYVLDDSGKRLDEAGIEFPIHTAQRWILSQSAPGEAEMSANLEDLLKAPEGEVVIDPSINFDYTTGIKDTLLDYENPGTNYGTNSYCTVSRDDRYIIGFDLLPELATTRGIVSAKLTVTIGYNNLSQARDFAAHKVTLQWLENTANYSTNGNYFEPNWYRSPSINILSSYEFVPVTFDVTQILKSHFVSSINNSYDYGYLITRLNSDGSSGENIEILTKEYQTQGYRPKLTVEYGATDYGVHINCAYFNDAIVRGWMDHLNMSATGDKFQIVRYLDEVWQVPISTLPTFCTQAHDKGLKVFIHSPVAATLYYIPMTANQWAWHIYELLYGARTQIDNGDIIAIEIGGEESDWGTLSPAKAVWFSGGFTPPHDMWFGHTQAGSNFAGYYLAARDIIKNSTYTSWKNIKIWSGGSPEKHESLDYNGDTTTQWGNAGNFIAGFIYTVRTTDRSKLPDAIAIHGYAGTRPPEYNANASGVKE